MILRPSERSELMPHTRLNDISILLINDIMVHNRNTRPTPTKMPSDAWARYWSTNPNAVDSTSLWAGKKLNSCYCMRFWKPKPRPMANNSANAGTMASRVL